jgi:hypothetical protein
MEKPNRLLSFGMTRAKNLREVTQEGRDLISLLKIGEGDKMEAR